MSEDIYKKLVKFCQTKNPARCWFDYPPTYLLSKGIAFEDIQKSIQELINSKQLFGLYINIPFCKSKCTYCMYYSEILSLEDREKIDHYLNALESEIKSYRVNFKKRKARHLYIGGGTPLLLSPKQLRRLFKIIYKNFIFDENSQFIIEGRPEDFIMPKIKILKENKINRVTIGIQSFDEHTLNKIGRSNRIGEIHKAFKNIRKIGIKYINTDIIVGLPGEGVKNYKETLRHLFKLSPDCISCTRILYGEKVRIQKIDQISDKVLENDYSFFDETFRQNNYFPIEKKEGVYLRGGMLDANNKLLFENLNCNAFILGFGARAISYLPNIRYVTNKTDDYIEALQNSNTNYYGMFLDKDDIMREYIILQLYLLQKINFTNFFNRFKIDLMKKYRSEINNLEKNDIIKIDKEKKLILLLPGSLDAKVFLYSMLKFLCRRDYIKRIIKIWRKSILKNEKNKKK